MTDARQAGRTQHLPERLSPRNRNRVSHLESSYRKPMVKHEPDLHMCTRAGYDHHQVGSDEAEARQV